MPEQEQVPATPADSLREQAARAALWSSIQTWGTQVLSTVVFLVLARLLAPQDFGLVALAGVVMALVQLFADQGFGQAIIQRRELDRRHLDTAFWISFGFSIVLAGIVNAVAGPVADLFGQPRLENVLRVLSIAFPLVGLTSVQEALFRRNLLFRTLAIRSLVAAGAGGAVGITLAVLGYGVWSLVAQLLAARGAEIVVLWSATTWKPRLSVSVAHFHELFSFGIAVVGTNLLNFLNRRLDDLLIGYFLGPVALGYYSVGYRVLRIVTNLLTVTISQVALPAFSRLQLDRARMVRAFYTATEMTSLVSFPAFVALAVLAPDIVPVLFGDRWDAAVPVMQVLAFIGILHSIYFFNDALITAVGKPYWVLGLTAANATANVPAFAVSVRWGIVWVAAAYVIRGYLLSPLPLLAIRRLIGIDLGEYVRRYRAPVAASVLMGGIMLGVRQLVSGQAITIVIAASVGLFVYAVALRALDRRLFRRATALVREALMGRAHARAIDAAPTGAAP